MRNFPKKNQPSQKKKSAPLPFQNEFVGALLLVASLLFLISLLSFSYAPHTKNWAGAIGYSIGWIFHSTLGIASYVAVSFLCIFASCKLTKRELSHPQLRAVAAFLTLLSLGVLLTLIEVELPSFGEVLKSFFYPKNELSHQHLGGLPLMLLYHDIPSLNLQTSLGVTGVLIIFLSLLIASLVFLFDLSLVKIGEELMTLLKEWREKRTSRKEVLVEAFATVKPETPPIVIRPRTTPAKPLFEEEEEHLPPPPPPKQDKREQALKAQAVWNGDFKNYKLPPLTNLSLPKKTDQSQLKKDLTVQAKILEDTLQSFGITAKVGEIHCGPTITSFEVHPAVGVKVQKIKALENDIALNLQAQSIRIIAPIPGKAAVGVEVPNSTLQEVNFREMMLHYSKCGTPFKIPLLLGKGANGEWVMSDLTKMPHLIIAGATGSGKSVCINAIIMSILLTARPDEIQLLMIDPKKVELTPYTKLPHMIAPVITSPHEAFTCMQWLVKEMEKRYDLLNRLQLRNIEAFNNRTIDEKFEKELPVDVPVRMNYIVAIIDELADLMMSSTYDIETPIARIAQMARAVGIHLILATQRPSREVITGLIKANFPTRICFKVSSGINSKIVLDSIGAEQLLGNGDMLFLPPGTSNLDRVQGAFVRDSDIQACIQFITEQAPPNYRIPSFASVSVGSDPDLFDPPTNERDVLYTQAQDIVTSTGNASTTFLQRKLKIGYARAASLIDQLEQNGIISAPDGTKARTVLAPRGKTKNDEEKDS